MAGDAQDQKQNRKAGIQVVHRHGKGGSQEHAFFRNAQGGKKKRVAHDISAGNGRHGKGHSSLTGQASDVPKMSLAVSGLLRLCSSRIMIWMITRR